MKQKITINLVDGRSYDINKVEIHQTMMVVRFVVADPNGDYMTFHQDDVAGIVYHTEEEAAPQ